MNDTFLLLLVIKLVEIIIILKWYFIKTNISFKLDKIYSVFYESFDVKTGNFNTIDQIKELDNIVFVFS